MSSPPPPPPPCKGSKQRKKRKSRQEPCTTWEVFNLMVHGAERLCYIYSTEEIKAGGRLNKLIKTVHINTAHAHIFNTFIIDLPRWMCLYVVEGVIFLQEIKCSSTSKTSPTLQHLSNYTFNVFINSNNFLRRVDPLEDLALTLYCIAINGGSFPCSCRRTKWDSI